MIMRPKLYISLMKMGLLSKNKVFRNQIVFQVHIELREIKLIYVMEKMIMSKKR